MKKRHPLSLYSRLIIALSLSGILLASLIATIIANQSMLHVREAYLDGFIAESRALVGDFMASGFEQSVYQANQQFLNNTYYSAHRYDLQGELIQGVSLRKDYKSRALSAEEVQNVLGAQRHFIVKTINDGSSEWTRLIIENTQDIVVIEGQMRLLSSVSKILIQNIAILIAIGSVFSVFIANRTSERIILPLETMTLEVNEMSTQLEREFTTDYTLESKEINILAAAFETLRKQVLSSLEAIQAINETLEQRVMDRTLDLTMANQELAISLETIKATQEKLIETQKQVAVSTLVRGVAHHLNTPLGNAMMGLSYLEELLRDMAEDGKVGQMDEGQITTNITSILRNLQRVAGIVNTLKQASVHEAVEEKSRVNPCEFMLEAIDLLKMAEGNETIQFELVCLAGHDVMMHPMVVLQVLTSIVENARDHAFSGIDHKKIQLMVEQVGGQLVINIQDNGNGIEESVADRMFDAFFSIQAGSRHTGLGLHIARNQVQSLGGTLDYRRCQQGACFAVKIPVEEVTEDA